MNVFLHTSYLFLLIVFFLLNDTIYSDQFIILTLIHLTHISSPLEKHFLHARSCSRFFTRSNNLVRSEIDQAAFAEYSFIF